MEQTFINVDELDPTSFSLNMFSADELLNQGSSYVTYYGYDHTGKKISGRPSFDDFFNAKDEFGNFTRPIGAFEPIYIAGYIMDKFSFDDLIFNVGVRIDRYDANQSVLKDQFLYILPELLVRFLISTHKLLFIRPMFHQMQSFT